MRLKFLVLWVLVLAPLARGTSVVPPSFPELVSEAEAIYRGRVTAVESRRVPAANGDGLVIKTFVTFAIDRVLKGDERKDVTLEFLGGRVGDDVMEISGMPRFNLGAQEFVFVQKNGVQFCPLVAMMHGRYRVQRDATTAREHIVRDNGTPLTATADVQLPMVNIPARARAASANALTPEAFEASIAAEVQRPAPDAHQR